MYREKYAPEHRCNVSGNGGAGISAAQSLADLSNTTVDANVGAGVAASSSEVWMRDGAARRNGGAGVSALDWTTLQIDGATLSSNGNSGLEVSNGSTAAVARATLAGNTALTRSPADGGGAFVSDNSSLAMLDTAVVGNAALRDGGGVLFDGSGGGWLSLARVVVRGNTARAFGGGVRAINALPLVSTVLRVAPAPALDFYLLPTSNGNDTFLISSSHQIHNRHLLKSALI